MKTILYARCSTHEQTLAHQITQAEKAGFILDEIVADEGISGVSTKLVDRPQGRRLFDMLRHGDTLVVRWVDRLGRDYHDVTSTLRNLMERGVIVKTVINSLIFDGATKDAMQMALRDSMIAFLAAMAQAQTETMKAAQTAGIAHAREHGKYRGRKPQYSSDQLETIQRMLGEGANPTVISKATGVSRQTIYRIKDNPLDAARALEIWAD